CGRVDQLGESRTRAFSALRGALTETQIFMVEHGFSNSTDFSDWVKSELLSTKKTAGVLRSVCDAVWVNRNVNDWIASTTNGHPTSMTAMVGNYRLGAEIHFVAISFDGRPVQQNGRTNDPDFFKVQLKLPR